MQVQLLGPLVITVTDRGDRGDGAGGRERTVEVGARKERAVFAALALRPGRVVSVGELVDVLWDRSPPATAVKTLQGYVSKMRRVLGPDVVATEQPGYVLRIDPEAVDVWAVDALVATARAHVDAARLTDAAGSYRAARACFRGEPLPDLAGSEVGRREIARLQELRLGLAEELLATRLALGEHHAVVPDLEAHVREAPLRERGWELLLLALYRAGRQADALRAYQHVRSLLVGQIGVEPGAALRALEGRIIVQDEELAWHAPEAAPPADDRPPRAPAPAPTTAAAATAITWASASAYPFAGRDDELDVLAGRWTDAAATAQRQAVLVGGEPGIGKTRLVAEAARAIQDAGGLVLFGRCEEGLAAPYQPFVEAIASFVRAAPADRLDRVVPPGARELTRLLPELRDRWPTPVSGPDDAGDVERLRLFEAVTELLERLAADQPVLLVLDDLQWATTSTMLLFRHIVTTTRPARLVVAGTYRTTALDRVHPLAAALADLRRHGSVHRVTLDGLDEDATQTLASTAADHELDETDRSLVRRLHRECGGNPFFFWALLTNLVETGMIVRRDGRWTHAAAVFDTPLPEGIREVVARRLSSLDERTNALLRVASLMGTGFDYRVLAAAGGETEDAVLDALDGATGAGVVVEQPEAFGRFAFAHDLVRRSLEEELSTTRRARLHWRLTETLTERYGERLDEHLDEVARHAIEGALAGDPTRAISIARRAGDAALDALAFEAAAAYYDDALGLVEDGLDARGLGKPGRDLGAAASDRLRYDLLLARGRALQRAGNPAFAEVVRDAVMVARRLGDAASLAAAVIELRHSAHLSITGVNDPELQGYLQEALDGLGPDEVGMRVRLLSMLALTLSLSTERERSLDLSARAVELAREAGDPQVLAQVLADHTWVITGPDTVDERIALGTEAVDLARRRDDHLGLINGCNSLASAYLELGDLAAAEEVLRQGIERADELRRPMSRWGFAVHEAALLSLRGDVPALLDAAETLLASATEIGIEPSTSLAVWSRLQFSARYEQGGLPDLEDAILSLAADQPVVGWQAVLAALYAETGRVDEAHRLLAALRATPPQRDLTWVAAIMLMTNAATAVGDRETAAWLHDELAPFAGRNTSDGVGTSGPVDLGLGRLAAALERWDAADAHLVAAAARCRAWRAPMWQARTAYEHGCVLLRRPEPDPERARAHLAEAATIAATTGQTLLADLVARAVNEG